MKDLNHKVAVITGAAEGIGKAIAVAAAAQGMKLVLADISASKLDATVQEFKANGTEVIGVVTDVASEAAIMHLAEQAFTTFGNVHLLVNNAGVAFTKAAWETTAQDWEWIMGVNLYGVTHALRAFIPRMLANGEEGHIVNTASMAGMISAPALAAYNVSKFGVVTLSEGLYHDLTLRQSKLGVSVLCPSWVNTRIIESERNRDASQRTDVDKLERISAKASANIMKAVQNGLTPEEVAKQVIDAVQTNQFYILTHADSHAAINVRAQDILQNRQPTLIPL